MRRIALVLVWASVAATVAGFFLPWAEIEVREPGLVKQVRGGVPGQRLMGGLTKKVGKVAVEVRRGTEKVTGELPSLGDIPSRVSGVQIPQMANQPNAKVAMALLELFTKERQHIGAKSYAVYLLPGLALLCGLLATFLGQVTAVAIGVAALCFVVAGAGFWKLLTTNTQALFVAITIGPGLWLSLWAYVGLAAGAACSAILRRGARG